jgi:arylsulfatase A-like enzyme
MIGRWRRWVTFTGVAVILSSGVAVAQPIARPNVLFIAIDDLRPALGCYGDPLAKTPHIDRLAAQSRVFFAAYCQQAVCGPSRTSVLTGRLPDNNRVWHNRHRFRDNVPDTVTLPQLFKNAGYRAQSIGKVFSGDPREEDPESWSVPAVLRAPGWRNSALPREEGEGKGAASEAADVADDGYTDGKIADLAIETLASLRGTPFFLAVGFNKPHLPFNAPRRYWDLHDPARFPAAETQRTIDAPEVAYPDHRELGGYRDVPKNEKVDPDQARRLQQGYYACVSYVDAQVGRLLEALDRLGLADDTMVVLWGDHGYSLGEAAHWCKATNFERDTRVPLLVRAPGVVVQGGPSRSLVEFVDIYPTVAELAGLTPPARLDGTSLVPILRDPSAPGRDYALSQYARPWKPKEPEVMGYSLRGPTHRYTRWVNWTDRRVVAEELYDYGGVPDAAGDPGVLVERRNLVADPRSAPVRDRLRAALDAMLANRIEAGAESSSAAAVAPSEPVILFRQGSDGVHTYRIPGVVVTARGTVLVYCEARRLSAADRGEIEIHLRRSSDGGRSWGPVRKVAHLGPRLPRNPHLPDGKKGKYFGRPDEQTVNNAIAIATREGRVHLLYCVEYMRGFHIFSDDDGLTWSAPREITHAFDEYRPGSAGTSAASGKSIDWQAVALGPGHGIQLESGRLVAPIWMSDYRKDTGRRLTKVAGVVFSDDDGATWRAGDVAIAGGNESCVAQLSDGRVMLTSRNTLPENRRIAAMSRDGATGWSPVRVIADLPEHGCMAGFLSHPGSTAHPGPVLLHSAPDTDAREHKARRDLTVWLSRDDGGTFPIKRLLRAGPAAYSDLAALPDGTVLCVYETGLEGVGPQDGQRRPWAYAAIAAARFDLAWLSAAGKAPARDTPPWLRVSENGRFLVHDDGSPFFWLGDTAWEIFHRLDRDQVARYLDDRASRGFTVVQAVALAELDGLDTPNAYGHLPLLDGDPARPDQRDGPDDDYWDHVDHVVAAAAARGLYVAFLPTWGGAWSGRSGRVIFTPENAREYGRWLGDRYRDASNIVWVLGGDRRAEKGWQREILRALAAGLAEGDGGRHLRTYHPRGGESSSEFFHADPWLDFNMLQSGHARSGTNYDMIAHDYSLVPTKPCLDGEPAYEYPADEMPPERPNNHNGALEVRRRAYWGVFAGGFGHTYGTHSIWQMYDEGRQPRWGVVRPWHESLELPGARQMVHLRRLMTSRPFLTRIPDQGLVTAPAEGGAGADRVQATRDGRLHARDATYLMAYFPGSVAATIDARRIPARQVRGWWFDPRTGSTRSLGEFDNAAPRPYEPPSGGDDNDWVLVLDDPSRGYGPPGVPLSSPQPKSPAATQQVRDDDQDSWKHRQ